MRAVKGVVAAGHPVTAEAGAEALRAGGNAVDAAVACVLMSFVAESPLTGPGRRRLHARAHGRGRGPPARLLRGGAGPRGRRAHAGRAHADRRHLRRGRGAGVQRRPLLGAAPTARRVGLAETLERFGTMPLAELTRAPAEAARSGVEVLPDAGASCSACWSRSSAPRPSARRSTRPDGRLLEAGDTIRLPELGDLLERLGAEGPGFLYEGDVAAAVSEWVLERGGLLTREDLHELRGGGARAGPRGVPRPRGAHRTRRRRPGASSWPTPSGSSSGSSARTAPRWSPR